MQGQEPTMQVAIHAGAAFTDHGRLLSALQANNKALVKHGVAYFGPRRYRRTFKPSFDAHFSDSVTSTADAVLRSALPAQEHIQRAVFTSSEFAGEQNLALQDGQLYPMAGQRMALLEHVYHDHEVELLFALRNPGTFIPKLLMSLSEADRAHIIRNTDLSCLSWIGMVDDIRDLAPSVRITLWCNEDTPLLWGDVVRATAGLPQGTELNGEYDLLLSLLTEEGAQLAKNEALADPDLPDTEVREILSQILEDHAHPEKVEEEFELPGWNAEIFDAFSELYEQDVARLETTPGVRLLRP